MITEKAKESFIAMQEDIRTRNRVLAKFLGWYQKNRDINIWYIEDENGNEIMVWTPLYNPRLPDDELPFFFDANQLDIVIEVLREQLPERDDVDLLEKDQWYSYPFFIDLNEFGCMMTKWDGENWAVAHVVHYTVGVNCGSWRVGLFYFISDICGHLLNQIEYEQDTTKRQAL